MEKEQVIKAAKALLKFAKTQDTPSDGKSQLFQAEESNEPIYIVIVAKRYFSDKVTLKPKLIPVPHKVYGEERPRICLFTKDPQREYKDVLYEPEAIVDRVIGVSKLKGKLRPYEARRLLKSQFDLFIAESDVIPMLPKLLGKVFYGSQSSTPIGVEVRNKEKEISATRTKGSIDKILSTSVFLKPTSTLLYVRIGIPSMKPKHIAANAEAVVKYVTENVVDKGIDGIRTIGIKTSTSPLLPVFYTSKQFEEEDVGEPDAAEFESEKSKRKREMKELDALLSEVVDPEEIAEYNLEQKRARRKTGTT